MTNPLQRAKQRLEALRVETREIERFIEMYETFDRGTTESQPGVAEETRGGKSSPLQSVDKSLAPKHRPVSPPTRRRNETSPREIVDLVERLIREASQPLTRGEILERLQARDIEITVADKARYVGTIMWRNKSKFVNIEGRGYWLRGEPIPKTVLEVSKQADLKRYEEIGLLLQQSHISQLREGNSSFSDAEIEALQREKSLIEDRNPDVF